MPLSYDEIRSAVIEYVRADPTGQVPLNLEIFASYEALGRRISTQDRETARQIFHELYLERVIISGASANSTGDGLMCWPLYVLTEYGKQVLASLEYQPHDPSGYLALLKQQVPGVNSDAVRYLDESLQCFQRGTLLASAVMLGCAAEKAALLLIEGFGNAIKDAAKKTQYEKETANWMISRKYGSSGF
jgi:hypothetical protein